MQDYDNLAALLGDADSKTQTKDEPDDVDAEDSRDEVFNSAAQEAFHALKKGDAQSFAEALKAALGAC